MRISRVLPVVIVVIVVVAAIAYFVLFRNQGNNAPVQGTAESAEQLPAEGGPVTVTLATPNLTSGAFSESLISAFETAHPGIKVSIVKLDTSIPPAEQSLERHLSAAQQYASSADVLFVANASLLGGNTTSLSVQATRAGYFLDLKPLVDEDTTLNSDDFYPAIWQSYQWDGGIWAIPFAADPYVLTYDKTAFDNAKLAYPDEKWTLDDLDKAIRQLSAKDASGKVSDPGFDIYGAQPEFLFRGMLASSLLDTSAIPNTPKFDSPEINALLKDWLKLDQDGMIGAEYNKAPLSISPAIAAIRSSGATPRGLTLLPGGKATLNVQGFAVSGGTQHPKEAYTLAEWLSTRGDVANNALATAPARKSLLGTGTSEAAFTLNVTPDIRTVLDKAIANGIPVSEMRYMDYLVSAYTSMKTNNTELQIALQTAESQAGKDGQSAADARNGIAMVVATPIPIINLPPGKIALKVAVVGYALPNQDQWNKLTGDFTASDPQVAQVILEKYLNATSLNQVGPSLLRYDCVYAPFNSVSPAQVSYLLNLDPFLDADKTFDKSDMVAGTLAQVTLDNKIWMLPSDLSPNVLKYDSNRFDKDGVPQPGPTWTVDQFADALKTLKADGTGPGFVPVNTFGAYIFQLIAAYGGNPIDYRATPPAINFTDPATVDAIQQVLKLAKDGDFKYHPLFSTRLDISFKPEPSTINQETLTAFTLPLPGSVTDNAKTKVTLFPKGSKVGAVTYNLGGFYISASAQDPEACYRFISKAAHTPALFSAMPARKSLLDDPTLRATQGADTVALYKEIATLLDDPNTLVFPGISIGSDRFQIMLQLELFEALDKTMLLNADLDSSLKDAETSAKAFEGCAASLPPLGVTTDAQRSYLNGFIDCAIKSDPAMTPMFAGLKTN